MGWTMKNRTDYVKYKLLGEHISLIDRSGVIIEHTVVPDHGDTSGRRNCVSHRQSEDGATK